MVVRPDYRDALQQIRTSHGYEQRNVAPVAMANEVHSALQILEKGNGLTGHVVVVERCLSIRGSPVAAPIKRRHSKRP